MLRVKMLAFQNADATLYDQGREKFLALAEELEIEFVEDQPDVLFFLSGGSERPAVDVVEPGKFYLLVAFQEGNSYAAATEVKAYLNQHAMPSRLVDYDDAATPGLLQNFHAVKQGLNALRGQRFGVIGQVSDWLIASDIDAQVLQQKLGIERRDIPWNSLPDFQTMPVADEILQTFQAHSSLPLEETAQVYALLHDCIKRETLDAITVECFSLVTAHAVTACLPLAKFNADGLPAACEGDVVSIAGMMLIRAVTGLVPWIVNTVKIDKDTSLFAHCTIAPTLLRDYTVTTHFETGKGTAIQGVFESDEMTIFRTNNTLTHAFLATASVKNRPMYDTACRTQIEVALSPKAVHAFREQPLGNHHLILPGDHRATLTLACEAVGLTLV